MIRPITDHKIALEYAQALTSYFTGICTIPYPEREPYIDYMLEVEYKIHKLMDAEDSILKSQINDLSDELQGGNEQPWYD